MGIVMRETRGDRPQYGGDDSRPFWRRVKRLTDEADHAAVYALGVALQNLEEFVLNQLHNAEISQQSERKRKSRGR
jgi:hypothetical protein